jgi:ABC-2 type transport system ATP-binding protein
MRLIAGLDRPTSGTVRVNGKHYPHAAAPTSELGILLDARSVHPGLSARNNLLALARTAGIGRRRVDEVIELAGLGEVAGTRAGGFSLGMGQRLGVAAALLGQPQTVVLDEPVNGLDPDGVRWIRLLLKERTCCVCPAPRPSRSGRRPGGLTCPCLNSPPPTLRWKRHSCK